VTPETVEVRIDPTAESELVMVPERSAARLPILAFEMVVVARLVVPVAFKLPTAMEPAVSVPMVVVPETRVLRFKVVPPRSEMILVVAS